MVHVWTEHREADDIPMSQDWFSLSEVVTGKVIKGIYSPNAVNAETLASPYDEILVGLKEGKDLTTLATQHGHQPIKTALDAAEAVGESDSVTGVDWIRMLERAAALARAGKQLERKVKHMARGEDVDIARVLGILKELEDERLDFVGMDKVEPDDDSWVPSYYAPWDKHIGGLPKAGLVLIGAPPGIGKSSLVLRVLVNCAHEGKRVAFYSMEMTLGQVARRLLDLEAKLTKRTRANILASENVETVDEVYAKVARLKAAHPDLYCVGIDFADLMIDDEQSEQVMGHIYKTLAVLAKRLKMPVILLSQLSRRYEGGLPRMSHYRYSGLAEAMASLGLLLWNPQNLFVDMGQGKKGNPLEFIEGAAYIICGKCLGRGTKVLLYDGTLKAVENVQMGDELMGPDSKPRRVLSCIYGWGQMYRIHQRRGMDYRVNGDHLLALRWAHGSQYALHHPSDDVVIVPASEWSSMPKTRRASLFGYKVSVDFLGRDLPLDPYVLGCWLGDGASRDAEITIGKGSEPIIEKIRELGYPTSIRRHSPGSVQLRLSDGIQKHPYDPSRQYVIQSVMRRMGLLNNKHIPRDYLVNSRANRLALLAGLIDTDGYYGEGHTYEITQKKERLAREIKFLCDSLGLRTSLRKKIAKSQLGTEVEVWQVNFGGDLFDCPIVLPRKRQRKARTMDPQRTSIRVEQDTLDEYFGFTLDGDGLFLLEDCTVTHNSRFGFKEGGVGAFAVDWDGKLGWGNRSYGWIPLSGGA